MKKLIILMMFLITSSLQAENDKINLHLNMVKTSQFEWTTSRGYNQTGLGLLIGGGALTISGILSSTEQYGLTGVDKKFFDNPIRSTVIISGLVVLSTGIIISIAR